MHVHPVHPPGYAPGWYNTYEDYDRLVDELGGQVAVLAHTVRMLRQDLPLEQETAGGVHNNCFHDTFML